MRMNETGNVVLYILIGVPLVILLPPILMELIPEAKILFQIISVFMLYMLVRGYLGDGPLTILVSAILIYFLVFKWFFIFSVAFTFQTLLSVQVFSVVIWGIGTRLRNPQTGQ